MYSDGEDGVVGLGSQLSVCLMGKCGAAVAAPQNEEQAAPVRSMADEPALGKLGRCGQHNVGLAWTAYNNATSTRGAMCQGGFELVRAALGNGVHSKAEG